MRLLSVGLGVFAVAVLLTTVSFGSVTMPINEKFTGAASGTEFTATFANITGGVRLTLLNDGPSSNPGDISEDLRIEQWYFNVDPSLESTLGSISIVFDAAASTYDGVSGTVPTINAAVDAYKADGDGYFDILFEFEANGLEGKDEYFLPTEIAVFEIIGAGVTENSFSFISEYSQKEYYSAVAIKGSAGSGLGQWHAATEPGTEDPPGVPMVPEPSTLIIWSLLGGLAFTFAWRRRRRVT